MVVAPGERILWVTLVCGQILLHISPCYPPLAHINPHTHNFHADFKDMFMIALPRIKTRKKEFGGSYQWKEGINGANDCVVNTLRMVSKCHFLVNQNRRCQISCLEKHVRK